MGRPKGFQKLLYSYRLRVLDTGNGHPRDGEEREMVAISCCMAVPGVFETCPGAKLQEKYSASAGKSTTDSGTVFAPQEAQK